MYIPAHFQIQELVPPDVFAERGELAITALDERLVRTLDQLRKAFGPCTVNDWVFGGQLTERCFRTPDCHHYKPYSQHSFGRAADCTFKNHTAEAVRKSVIASRSLFPYITFIEDTVSWFHFDVRNCERIQLWNPDTNESLFV